MTQISNHTELPVKETLPNSFLFKFEEEFMPNSIRCIPMIARLKLDVCGIKLKLKEWNKLQDIERNQLIELPAKTADEKLKYRKFVQELILNRTGEQATDLTVETKPAWSDLEKIHESLLMKLAEFSEHISPQEWQSLTDLQRFTLIKLSRPSHENKNFSKAAKEFGLTK